MSRASLKRLRTTQNAVDRLQPTTQALNDMYSRFVSTGELSTHLGHAWHVLERALIARRGTRANYQGSGKPLVGPAREQVFREAAHSFEPARIAARFLIRTLVDAGRDPSDPEFIPSDIPPHEFGTAALHLLGWPDRWVRPEYEHQMARVMRQHAEVRATGQRSDLWYRDFAPALAAFLAQGQLPATEEFLLAVLTIGEMFALNEHYLGRGGEDLLAAYEAVANATDQDRESALRLLGALQARHREVNDARS